MPTYGRREPRYLMEVPIKLIAGRKTVSLVTEDVSYRGVFLRTDVPLALRQLVKIELTLPPDHEPFSTTGMLVHAIPRGEDGRAPGVGLQFYGIGREAQAVWDRFIAYARTLAPEAGERAVVIPSAKIVDPMRR